MVLRNIALILLVLFVFVIPTEKVVVLPGLGSVARIVGALAMLTWGVSVLLGSQLRSIKPFHTFFFLFILWNCASLFWSVDVDATQGRIITWVQLGLVVLLMWDLLDSRELTIVAIQAYVLGAMFGAGGIVYNFLGSTEFVYGRYSAAGQHSVNIGLIIALAIPLAWYLVLQKQKNTLLAKSLRVLNILFLPLACIGIALTGSRGAMIASLPAIIFIVSTLGSLPVWARLFSSLIAMGGAYTGYLLIPKASLDRLGTAYAELSGGGNLTGRTEIWHDAYLRFRDNPILGVGSDAFATVSEQRLVAHNSFLSVLVETGLVGLILFSALFVMALVYTFDLPKLESNLWKTVLFIWFLGASALTYEHHKPTWLVLALIVGSRYHYAEKRDSDTEPPNRPRVAGEIVL